MSTFDASKIDLRANGVLVSINISSYSGIALDRVTSEEVAHDKGSKAGSATDAFRVGKVIYHRSYLTPVSRISLGFYKWLRSRSHEWAHGVYLIKAEFLNEVLSEYHKAKTEWQAAVDNLLSPKVRAEALQSYRDRAGKAFDESVFPSEQELQERFQFNIDIEQLPDPKTSANIAFKIGAEAAERISQDTQKKLRDKANQVSKETAERLASVVSKIHQKLSESENAIFRDTLIGNLRDAVELIDTINIVNDPDITAIRDELSESLCRVDPQVLRDDPSVREQTAKQAKKLAGKLGKIANSRK